MLKKRIIPVLLYHKGRLVKSKKFTNFRDVGHPLTTAKIYCDQDADELLILNIDSDQGDW
jgi:cyclase